MFILCGNFHAGRIVILRFVHKEYGPYTQSQPRDTSVDLLENKIAWGPFY